MSTQFKAWIVLAAIFIAGIATGFALAMTLGPRFHGPPGPRDMRGHFMTVLNQRLHLTDEQRGRIEPIIAEASQKLEALHHSEMDKGAQIFHDIDDKLDAILTPEQKAELKKMQDERDKMFSGRRGPWGPGREGPGPMHHFDDHGGPNDHGPDEMPPPPPPAPKDGPADGQPPQ